MARVPSTLPTPPPQNVAGPSGSAILIADDDPISIRLLRAALAAYRDVRFATNGQDALRLAGERVPDLVLLDGEMPGQSGFEVCATLKADDRLGDVPVIFVTSHADVEFETRALELGAADFITKPISAPIVQLRVKLHLELKHQLDHQRRLATVDGLTGLANRRALDAALEREWRRAVRGGKPLSLVLIDVDHFKGFNDTYGHPAGDDCLRQIAETLRGGARRASDLPGRFGGEEFAMVLPETNLEGATVVANSVRRELARAAIPHAASPVSPVVTVSMGLASTAPHPGRGTEGAHGPPTTVAGDVVRALVQAADRGLYRAKAAGRNRIEVAALEEGDLPGSAR